MIVTKDEWNLIRVYLDETLPSDFSERLLLEMMQIARPYGRGALEAEAMARTDLSDIVVQGVKKSRVDFNGVPHDHGAVHFDYVAGHRLKVSFYPNGLLDEHRMPVPADRGLPVVVSKDFDVMYGDDALESVIRVALI